jgi:hypothetical protein
MLKELRRSLAGLDKDDLLEVLGVEQRRSSADKLVPALALFGAGVLVGVGVGLMLAPKSGEALRDEVRERLAPEGA